MASSSWEDVASPSSSSAAAKPDRLLAICNSKRGRVHKKRKVKMLINRPLLRGGEETSDVLKEAIKTTDHKKDI